MEYSIYAVLASMLTGCAVPFPRVPAYAFDGRNSFYLSYVEQVPAGSATVTAPVTSNMLATASTAAVLIDALPALAAARAEYTSKTTLRSIEIYISDTNTISDAAITAILQSFNESIISR